MAARSKMVPRCIRCRLLVPYCVCDAMPRLSLDTRLVLVMHHRERTKASATAPLITHCLPNSELRLHGLKDRPIDFGALATASRRVLFLYPSSAAEALTPALVAADPRPVTLMVPDGNWRQASRMYRRLLPLCGAEPVRLPEGDASSWRLRREVTRDRLSTFEAVARALGILETSTVQESLETFFDILVRNALAAKGNRGRRTWSPEDSFPLEGREG